MDDEMLRDQRRLVELLEEEGWDVTDVELTAYDSPWADEDDPEATVTLTARKAYGDGDSRSGERGRDADGDDNPFRLK
ncbi:hypothetical protein [Natrononativus amylolyticus]|uniref:hypothetical protein n=1 Tax=Natrononativus amylolyticus TaxID=2963434 RepID=UPI0020CFDD69|nr:hypothetical protein [Natrononativus amylolyticus]